MMFQGNRKQENYKLRGTALTSFYLVVCWYNLSWRWIDTYETGTCNILLLYKKGRGVVWLKWNLVFLVAVTMAVRFISNYAIYSPMHRSHFIFLKIKFPPPIKVTTIHGIINTNILLILNYHKLKNIYTIPTFHTDHDSHQNGNVIMHIHVPDQLDMECGI